MSLFLLLGPTFLTFFTLMFAGSYFLLILSYLATKAVPFGKVTTFGVSLRLRTIFSLISCFSCDLYQIFFLILVLLLPLKLRRLQMLAARLVSPHPFVFFLLFYISPQYNKDPFLFFTDCFPLPIPRSPHHFDLSCMFCALKLVRFQTTHINTQKENRPISAPLVYIQLQFSKLFAS